MVLAVDSSQQQKQQGVGVISEVQKKKKKMMMMMISHQQNPITEIQTKIKEVETHFRTWVSKQSMPVEAAVVTLTGAVQGAVIGAFIGTIPKDSAYSFPPSNATALSPQTMASLQQAQALAGGPLIQARNFAVMSGVNAGISCVMKRIRGKEDVQSSMLAAFGSGAMFTLVSGMSGPNLVGNAVFSGLVFALLQGGIFKLGERIGKPSVEDNFYSKTRSMLTNLGLQTYEKNFKKGLLTDTTLPLLTDSALRDARIPPGPRLLILDHIQRDANLKGYRKR